MDNMKDFGKHVYHMAFLAAYAFGLGCVCDTFYHQDYVLAVGGLITSFMAFPVVKEHFKKFME